MNKIKILLMASVFIVTAESAFAQKTGYIRVDDVVALMPEISTLQATLQKYEADSIQSVFNYSLAEYRRKDSIVNGKDSLKTPPAVRAKMRQEMQASLYELQNWETISNQMLQQKQEELLEPLYRKAVEAIQQVAKENGYTYVYAKDVLIVAPPGDDLLPLVANKLKLKLPPNANAAAGR